MSLNHIRKLINKFNNHHVNKQANDKYSSFIELIGKYCGSIENKTVLEIGSDWNGELLYTLKNVCNAKEVYGINLSSCNKKLSNGIYHLKRDAEETGFDDNQFDYIFSLATFEHINNLSGVLKEAWRILKDKGVLFTLFGPIWSSAWGHHLWITVDNKTYNYINTKLPSFCHLISNESEVIDYLKKEYNYPKNHCEMIAKYVFSSKEQNRLFYNDYREIISESNFKPLLFAGHKNIPFSDLYDLDDYVETLDFLSRRHPENQGQFGYNAISALLYKCSK